MIFKCQYDTRHGRSRAQHVRDREADIERAKNWRLVHLRRSKGKARRAEPTFWLCFRAKVAKEANGEAQRGRADALAVIVLWRKENRAARPVGPSRRDRFWWRLIKNAKF